VAGALREVGGLHKNRTEAKESPPVLPVADDVLHATLDKLPPIVADMVQLQRFTGCRPEEVCLLRPCDVDTTSAVWSYRPESHKTQHHGRERVVFIGPRAQALLRPYLLRPSTSYCFCPAEGERKRREAAHEARQTPINAGNRPGTNKRARPAVKPGERYDVASYRRAIYRACELAFKMPAELRQPAKDETDEQKATRQKAAAKWRATHCWAPNRLRHSAATEIRKRYGIEGSQVVLGHSSADVSQVYAERDLAKAAEIMREVG
jgi:integrase